MAEVPDTVDDAIDALTAPSTDEVLDAARAFSSREIASSAVSRVESGGGGSQAVLVAVLELSSAWLKAPSRMELVAAPGVGRALILPSNLSPCFVYRAGATPYTLTPPGEFGGATELTVGYDSALNDFVSGGWLTFLEASGIIDGLSDKFVYGQPNNSLGGGDAAVSFDLADAENQPLVITWFGVDGSPASESANPPAAGDGTITVILPYLNVSTVAT